MKLQMWRICRRFRNAIVEIGLFRVVYSLNNIWNQKLYLYLWLFKSIHAVVDVVIYLKLLLFFIEFVYCKVSFLLIIESQQNRQWYFYFKIFWYFPKLSICLFHSELVKLLKKIYGCGKSHLFISLMYSQGAQLRKRNIFILYYISTCSLSYIYLYLLMRLWTVKLL